MNDQYSEMLIKKRINFLCFFDFKQMFLNLVLRARLVCPTYCIPQPPSLQVRTYITSPIDLRSLHVRNRTAQIIPYTTYFMYLRDNNQTLMKTEFLYKVYVRIVFITNGNSYLISYHFNKILHFIHYKPKLCLVVRAINSNIYLKKVFLFSVSLSWGKCFLPTLG